MPYSMRIADPALADLDETLLYIVQVLKAPSAAAELLNEFQYKLDLISDKPFIYGIDPEISGNVGEDVRSCFVKNYKIWFYVDEPDETANIVAFTHARQDAQRILWRRF